ncbi:Type IV fimbrial assembly, ATPase PilB [Thioalkalivibrio nitratireducens DSM 14787]|uniref:Type IV fimbrial assembly, ATPase PilB n=1 Tax=Thioalkalivibrio nitratireducens (strain DSM 14787 / UNIQEM 213 / ALEN2) TaxID=1255043 RepID=L0DXA4_THIND|nr:type IV-A pilus assembly ATPase PilB [Thioalkalivibrio nitratireducens]AGA34229.1 Type IV fimbrial assembly, ATPase PilB [Thioalkalivibrio nitratireducens DSM 14787]
MPNPVSSVRLPGLARRLVDAGLAETAAIAALVDEAREQQTPLVAMLATRTKIPEGRLAEAAGDEFGLPVFDLAAFDRDLLPKEHLIETLIRKHHALPLLQRGNRLFVAISDPTNLSATDEFKFATGLSIETVLVEHNKLDRLIEDSINAAMAMMGDLDDDGFAELAVSAGEEERNDDATEGIDDAPVVRFVNKLMLDAIRRKASDIHLEPYDKDFRVRFRIDGVLYDVGHPPITLAPRIIARVKVMSRMDIAERRIPQDGRIKLKLSRSRAIDFRISSCPTLYGEKIVMRILDSDAALLSIDVLGFDDEQKKHYLGALKRPYGMILVTGPTGSGKTVTLYTGMAILNTNDRNISTAEDPAEINMPGINQVNVHPKIGLTFANALRAFLRQDPDVIMVGEIRDLETAEIAIKAAQTGHLVLSTLHTNDAPQTLTRLANMGVPAYNLASSILLIIAQRLARRLCPVCKEPEQLPEDVLLKEGFSPDDISEGITLYRPVGCDQCTDGYKGRVGIYQVLPISETMQRLILEGGNSMQMADQAEREGVNDLRRAGLLKARAGVTSLEEINRVTTD